MATILNAVDFGVPNDGRTPIGETLNRACAAAFNDDHAHVFLPLGVYRATKPILIDHPVSIIGAGDGTCIMADWQRGYDAAITLTGANGAGGKLEGFTIWAAPGTTGGCAIQLDATSGVYGSHRVKLSRLTISSGGQGEWNWCVIVEGRHNTAGAPNAPGLRTAVMEDCCLFFARYGYVYCANAIRFWIRGGGFYVPANPQALAAQPDRGLPGVAAIAGSYEVAMTDVDIG